MDKEIFLNILQAALLNFDGVEIDDLVEKYDVPKPYALTGINLCNYLKSIKLEAKKENLITSEFSQFTRENAEKQVIKRLSNPR